MKLKDGVELEPAASAHVDKLGQVCLGRDFVVVVGDVNTRDESFPNLFECQTCKRAVSIINGKVFDPNPPKRKW